MKLMNPSLESEEEEEESEESEEESEEEEEEEEEDEEEEEEEEEEEAVQEQQGNNNVLRGKLTNTIFILYHPLMALAEMYSGMSHWQWTSIQSRHQLGFA